MDINLEDLSYSKIVDLIQEDKHEGAKMLKQLAFEIELLRLDIKVKEDSLNSLKNRVGIIRTASIRISDHLKIKRPFSVIANDLIIVVSDEDITVERNCIK